MIEIDTGGLGEVMLMVLWFVALRERGMVRGEWLTVY